MTRGQLLGIAALVLAMLAGSGTWAYLHRAKAAMPRPVAAQPASSTAEIMLTGHVAPRDAVAVASPFQGVLEVVEVPLGAEVLMGQIIGRMANQRLIAENNSAEELLAATQERVATIEGQLTAAKLEAARATAEATANQSELDRARINADRQEQLFKEGATSRNAYEAAKKAFATAQSDYAILRESARSAEERTKTLTTDLEAIKKSIDDRNKALEESAANLRTGEVVSPIDGVLIASKAQPGDDVPDKTLDLFHVAPSALKLSVALEPDPAKAAVLRDGLDAFVTLVTQPDTPFPGKVVKTADGRWEVHFDTPTPMWKPNDQASVRIRLP